MPELPEVETVKNGMAKVIFGKKIAKTTISGKNMRAPWPERLEKRLKNTIVKDLSRRSKYVLVHLSSGEILYIHLGMSGKILFSEAPYKSKKHDHMIIEFDDGIVMIFNDARRFGLVGLAKEDEIFSTKEFAKLGVEPLTDALDGKYLQNIFKNKSVAIKQAIMDGNNLVGVGNIYASESLHLSKINPTKPSNEISLKKLEELSKNIKIVLQDAIKSGGSTLRDYVRSDGTMGYFQHSFKVYGRENEPCFSCNGDIKRIVQQGRSTFYCVKCQK